jgi:hypothetical protein
MKYLLIFAVFFIGLATNSAYAAETNQSSTFALQLSDYVNANWGWLLLAAIVCILLGWMIPGIPAVGVILIILIVLNYLLLSPMLHP